MDGVPVSRNTSGAPSPPPASDACAELVELWEDYFRLSKSVSSSNLHVAKHQTCAEEATYYSLMSELLRRAVQHSPFLCEAAGRQVLRSPDWELSVIGMPPVSYTSILKSSCVGQLTTLRGVVNSSSTVIPLLYSMNFICDSCGQLVHQIMPQLGVFNYPTPQSSETSSREPLTRGSDSNATPNVAICACTKKSSNNFSFSRRSTYTPLFDQAEYVDAQILCLQERGSGDSFRGEREGANMHLESEAQHREGSISSIEVVLVKHERFFNIAQPGDIVTVNGILSVGTSSTDALRRSGGDKAKYRKQGGTTGGLKSLVLMARHITLEENIANESDLEGSSETDIKDVSKARQGMNFKSENRAKLFLNKLKAVRNSGIEVDLIPTLLSSFCSSILGHETVKLGILLCAVAGHSSEENTIEHPHAEGNGGLEKEASSKNPPNLAHYDCEAFRAPLQRVKTVHLLVLGPAGVGKSHLLQEAATLLPHSVFACGPTASNTGLGVAWSRSGSESYGSGVSLQGGVLTVGHRGITCLDEIDKMSSYSYNTLYEAMDRGELSVAKASVLHSVPANTCLVAAGNTGGRIPRALFTRFDLVFVLSSQRRTSSGPENSFSQRTDHLGRHLLRQMFDNLDDSMTSEKYAANTSQDTIPRLLSPSVLRAVLRKLRSAPTPRLAASAEHAIARAYVSQRMLGTGMPSSHALSSDLTSSQVNLTESQLDGLPTTTTLRRLHSLYKLVLSMAKLRYKTEATDSDVQDVLDLLDGSACYENDTSGLGISLTSNSKQFAQSATQPGKKMNQSQMRDFFEDQLRDKLRKGLMKDNVFNETFLRSTYHECFEEYIRENSRGLQSFEKMLRDLNASGSLLMQGSSSYRLNRK